MSSIQDMESLWATYFTTPFPKSSSKFWTKYPAQTINAGFEAMSRKLQAGHTFSTLADACRFATAVMRSHYDEKLDAEQPAPAVRTELSQAGV
ncbi:MAG: hypothetical protein ACLQLC_06975 [Candidatus Sulfotelmatobacter sp.]